MDISQFTYSLPPEFIAQQPLEPRDLSKLMVIDRKTKNIEHLKFYRIQDLLTANDVLVFNNSKVFPARLIGKKETGGNIEILLLEESEEGWIAMHKGKTAVGSVLNFGNLTATVTDKANDLLSLKFDKTGAAFWKKLQKNGRTPLPPYINSTDSEALIRKKYQTVFANPVGSAAAPTAGFHFTKKLLDKLEKIGVQTEFVTLHVGPGTFQPVKEKDLKKHLIHKEHFIVENDTVARLNKAKAQGKRIIAVGTTTTRVLETLAQPKGSLTYDNSKTTTQLFIYPPYKFRFVDALITNFHLPKSTLLALVSAFVSKPNTGKKFIDFKSSLMGKAYVEAMEKNYRFYSFGDAMFIK